MERKIGETFGYDGVMLKVEDRTSGCNGCYFEGQYKNYCRNRDTSLFCGSFWRTDNKNVMYVKVE